MSPRKERSPQFHIFLFLATIVTTIGVGGSGIGGLAFEPPFHLMNGIAFSATLLVILGVHELGHYFISRGWGMRVSLPFFIPVPFGLGTFGAFIRLRSPIHNRRVLFDVGASGPLAGFVVTVPAIVIGLMNSEVLPLREVSGGLALGSSLLFSFLARVILGVSPDDYTIILHPIALGGWLGLFVTVINLLPIGQLDGGHIIYALFGRRQRTFALATLAILIPLGYFYWAGWFLWAGLAVVFGFRHPPLLDDSVRLDFKRKVLGWICLAVFVVSFTPAPFRLM
jgi:membrane-associated protease RseP (regulator of RpoE activity)